MFLIDAKNEFVFTPLVPFPFSKVRALVEIAAIEQRDVHLNSAKSN